MKNEKICVIGLGYVGLPLLFAFSERYEAVGIDISMQRVEQLKQNIDVTREVSPDQIKNAACLFSTNIRDAEQCTTYIVSVPTPIDDHFQPDLEPLIKTCANIATVLKKDDLVIFESTVYPGTTEEICVPVLEANSGLVFNRDFFVGYSPERINPGDKTRSLKNIPKVVSGSNKDIALRVKSLYDDILEVPTYLAPSIRVAEASKVIENTQRDMNIAIMNEFSRIFSQLNINLNDVIAAARTKWNFLPFEPGLVGGHCIGVDPYYLISKSIASGYSPDFLMSGRKINESMAGFVADRIIFSAVKRGINIKGAKILILGYAFKKNCPDIRNTKVSNLRAFLERWGANVIVTDDWVDEDDARNHNILRKEELLSKKFDIIVLAVDHEDFEHLTLQTLEREYQCNLVFDLKNLIDGAENVYQE